MIIPPLHYVYADRFLATLFNISVVLTSQLSTWNVVIMSDNMILFAYQFTLYKQN